MSSLLTQSNGHLVTTKIAIPTRVNPYTLDIPVDQILPWDGNPSARTTEKALKELLDAIRDSGTITEIAAVNNDDGTVTIGDGHRRWMSAKALGVRKMTVRVFPSADWTAEKLYKALNTGVRTQKPQDWLEAHVLCGVLPPNAKLASNIKFCVRACGSREETRRIMLDGERRISPNIVGTIYSAAVFLDGHNQPLGNKAAPISERQRQLFDYIIKHTDDRMRQLLRAAPNAPGKWRVELKRALGADRPIKMS